MKCPFPLTFRDIHGSDRKASGQLSKLQKALKGRRRSLFTQELSHLQKLVFDPLPRSTTGEFTVLSLSIKRLPYNLPEDTHLAKVSVFRR